MSLIHSNGKRKVVLNKYDQHIRFLFVLSKNKNAHNQLPKNEFFQTPFSICQLMVPSPLLGLPPMTKIVQFVTGTAYNAYI